MKTGDESFTARGKLVLFAYEPQRPNPKSKTSPSQCALRPIDAGVCGGVCGFAAAVADAGVCAQAWTALRAFVVKLDGLQPVSMDCSLVSGHDFSRAENAPN